MLKTLVFVLLAACGGSDVCEGDHCVCAANDDCTHDCTTGGNTCEVQCAPGHDCDVGCAAGEDCRVECSGVDAAATRAVPCMPVPAGNRVTTPLAMTPSFTGDMSLDGPASVHAASCLVPAGTSAMPCAPAPPSESTSGEPDKLSSESSR